MAKFESILLFTFITFLVFDLLIIPFSAGKNLAVENRYFKFHQKYGVKRTSILKILLGTPTIIVLLDPPGNIGIIYLITTLYLVYLLWLFILIISALPNKGSKSTEINRNPMDSLIGFLVYPFEYLDTKKQFYPDQPRNLKWSWLSFFIPEYWYFNNEILGAGFISWAFLILYLILLINFGSQSLIIILLIRIISGFFGQKLYYARYGKWA